MEKIEQLVLALAVEFPEHGQVMLDNCDDMTFTYDYIRRIYRTIKEMTPEGAVFWVSLENELEGKIQDATWTRIKDTLRGIPASMARQLMLDSIAMLKAEQARKSALRIIEGTVKKARIDDGDVQHLSDTIERMKLIGIEKEDHSINAAKLGYESFLSRGSTNIKFGLETIDAKIDCLFPGELVTILGRTTVGKTFLCLHVINNILTSAHYPMALFSLEMPKHLIYERLLQVYFCMGRWELKENYANINHADFAMTYSPFMIFDKIYSVAEIKSLLEENPAVVAMIDFSHLLRVPTDGTPYQKMTQIFQDLKRLAKDLNICLIVLHQLSRAGGYGQEPVSLDMARESGSVEELSDIVLGIWRPGLKPDAPEELKNILAVKLLKNKRGEGVGIDCIFDSRTGIIREKIKHG